MEPKRDEANRDCETWKESRIEARAMQAPGQPGMMPEADCGDGWCFRLSPQAGMLGGYQEMEQGRP